MEDRACTLAQPKTEVHLDQLVSAATQRSRRQWDKQQLQVDSHKQGMSKNIVARAFPFSCLFVCFGYTNDRPCLLLRCITTVLYFWPIFPWPPKPALDLSLTYFTQNSLDRGQSRKKKFSKLSGSKLKKIEWSLCFALLPRKNSQNAPQNAV